VGVINKGISGNGLLAAGGGPKAPDRFDRDVLAQPGVQWVIFADDVINDINTLNDSARPSAQALIDATKQLIARAHARNIKFLCATLTPFNHDSNWTAAGEQTREQFDAFLRTADGGCDGVVDFDAATHSSADPTKWNPALDGGDDLHPNDAGLQAMGNIVSLDLFGAAGGSAPPPISLAAAFDNIGVADDAHTDGANWDGGDASFSNQALAAAGLTAGAGFTHGGVTFTWPASAGTGTPDNAIATGQLISASGSGTTLGFLISASYGPASAAGTLQYSDGTTQSYTLASPDWFVTGSAPGIDVAAVSSYQDRPGNQRFTSGAAVFFVGVPLAAGKTLAGVRLPSAGVVPVQAGTPTLHVFSMAIGR
jgi:lysophospholipase L1-like esterase